MLHGFHGDLMRSTQMFGFLAVGGTVEVVFLLALRAAAKVHLLSAVRAID